jgi:hypothetical protein
MRSRGISIYHCWLWLIETKGVLSFKCFSAMHSQSSNSGAVGVADVAWMLDPALSVNHRMNMDQLSIIWYIGPLKRIMRHQYIPLLVTADWGKGVLASTRPSAMQSPSLLDALVFEPMRRSNIVLRRVNNACLCPDGTCDLCVIWLDTNSSHPSSSTSSWGGGI